MGKPSKEGKIQDLFFNEYSKQWHFKDLLKQSEISRDKLNKWLVRYEKERMIKKVKISGKHPYYISNFEDANFRLQKRIYALSKLRSSELANELLKLERIKTAILFGSFSRADWNRNSDIDLFILGDTKELNKPKYERILGREIQIFEFKNKSELKRLSSGLLGNILSGIRLKGSIDFFNVGIQ